MKARYRILSLLAAATLAQAGPKVAKDLEGVDPTKEVDVIVQFTHAPGDGDHAKVRANGGQFKKDLLLVNAGLYSIPPGQLKKLAEDPDVRYISPDRAVTGLLDIATQATNAKIAQSYNWDGTRVGVAVIDSGVDAPELNPRVVYKENFVPSASDALDEYGHGSHVAGIIAGSGSLWSGRYKGIAPAVRIVNLRVLDRYARGTDSAVIAAIDRAIKLKSKYNIRVINLSLGRPVMESYLLDPLCQAAEAAWRASSWWRPRGMREGTTRRIRAGTQP